MHIYGLRFKTPADWIPLVLGWFAIDSAGILWLRFFCPGGRAWLHTHLLLWLIILAVANTFLYFWLVLSARTTARFFKPEE